jgi:hypothetical protein
MYFYFLLYYFRTLSSSITTDNIGQSPPPRPSLINTHDEFESRLKSMTISSIHQENVPPLPIYQRSMTISAECMIFFKGETAKTSILIFFLAKKSIDDDNEVENSFPVDNFTSKSAQFAVPRPPRTRPSLVRILLNFFFHIFTIFLA